MDPHIPQPSPHPTDNAVPATPPAMLRLTSAELFAAGREIQIDHAGELYRLRLTRNDRLILTK